MVIWFVGGKSVVAKLVRRWSESVVIWSSTDVLGLMSEYYMDCVSAWQRCRTELYWVMGGQFDNIIVYQHQSIRCEFDSVALNGYIRLIYVWIFWFVIRDLCVDIAVYYSRWVSVFLWICLNLYMRSDCRSQIIEYRSLSRLLSRFCVCDLQSGLRTEPEIWALL